MTDEDGWRRISPCGTQRRRRNDEGTGGELACAIHRAVTNKPRRIPAALH